MMRTSRQPYILRLLLLALLFYIAPVLLCLTPAPAFAQFVPDASPPVCASCYGRGCSECRPTSDEPVPRGDTRPPREPRPPRDPKPAAPTVSAAERRQREVYAREKAALLSAFKLPDAEESALPKVNDRAPNAFTDSALSTRFLQASGLTEAEWARARDCQAEIDAITRTMPPSEKDSARLENLLTERNTLWAKATSAPGLTPEDRARLSLKLFTVPQFGNGPVPSVTVAPLQTLRPAPATVDSTPTENPIALTMMRQTMVDSTVSFVEQAGEDWAGDLLGDAAGARFGTVLGLAKVVIAAREDTADGLAAMGDVLVGIIPIPQANIAQAGGRAYANVAYQAMNSFMVQSMQAVGGTADTEAFWKELDDELSVNMRAYRKWVGFGS